MSDESAERFERLKRVLAQARTPQARAAAIGELLAEYRPYLQYLARPLLTLPGRRVADSEDIAQSVCRRLAERIDDERVRLLTEGQFRSLLRTMVRNLFLDRPRTPAPQPLDPALGHSVGGVEVAADGPTPSVDVAADEARRVLLAEIERALQPDEFYLVRRRLVDGADLDTLADEFGLKPDSVRMRVRWALDKLRVKLKAFEEWLED